MVRKLILLLTVVAAVLPMVAQSHYVPHISIGAHAGASLSEYTFNPSSKQKFHNGFYGGVRFRYAEERHVGLLAELNINQRGWTENYKETDLEYSRTLTFIELPVMTHIFFGSRVVKAVINLGPQVGYMLGSSVNSNFDYRNPSAVQGFPANRPTEQLSLDIHNRFDYGIAGGVGVEFNLNPRHAITLEGRFYYGLGNIYASSRKDPFSASRAMSITVTAGYWFRLK